MNYKTLISIIIPVYKVQDLLKRCLESVISQTYKYLEIILVDDGSPDDCGEICDLYAQKDSRIRVIHKKNGGLSDARNSALDIATGEYVVFVDSDDFVSPYYVEHLIEALSLTGADMAISNVITTYFNQDNMIFEQEIKKLIVISHEECLKKTFYQDNTDTFVYGRIIKYSYFNSIRFPKGKLYEDLPVTYKLIEQCHKIAVINNTDYYYYQRRGSIQHSEFSKAKMDAVYHADIMKKDIKERYPKLSNAVNSKYFSVLCNILFQINDIENFRQEKEYIWQEIMQNRSSILFDREGRLKARLAAITSYAGYRVMKFIYSIVDRNKLNLYYK